MTTGSLFFFTSEAYLSLIILKVHPIFVLCMKKRLSEVHQKTQLCVRRPKCEQWIKVVIDQYVLCYWFEHEAHPPVVVSSVPPGLLYAGLPGTVACSLLWTHSPGSAGRLCNVQSAFFAHPVFGLLKIEGRGRYCYSHKNGCSLSQKILQNLGQLWPNG